MLPVVVGLDLGTTHCKAIALCTDGEIIGSASSSYPLHTHTPGQAEQDADEVWQGACQALRRLAALLHGCAEPQALCLSGAMHSILPIGPTERPLARATTWADNRAAPLVPQLRSETDAFGLYQRTGCPVQAPYHPVRLRWWTARLPHATRWVALKDWVLFRLTGHWATDLALASTTGLLNHQRLTWDDEALTLAGVTAQALPPLVPSTEHVGPLTEEAARETALPVGLPIIAGGSDGTLTMLGLGLTRPGSRAITVGTSGAVRSLTTAPHLDPTERTWCYFLEQGLWVAGGAINNGGLVLAWLREQFYLDLLQEAAYQQIAHDVQTIPPGADGLFFLPYLTGERSPFWNAAARGTLHGLTLAHHRAHIARAALESVAFCLASVAAALWGETPAATPIPLTGGITRMEPWVQIVADILGQPLIPMEGADASAIGAASLAQPSLLPSLSSHHQVTPDPTRHAHYQELHAHFQSLTNSLLSLQQGTPYATTL